MRPPRRFAGSTSAFAPIAIVTMICLAALAAMDEKVEEKYRFYTLPASNTAVGHIILENAG
ncbi:MAG: hypothetical protein AB7F96_08930 [Beijerinckiaceae bacterium]